MRRVLSAHRRTIRRAKSPMRRKLAQTLRSPRHRKMSAAHRKQPTAGDPVTVQRLLELLRRQKGRCALTGSRLTPANCGIDHVVPLVQGGAHGMSNIQLVCIEANRMKGGLSQADFIKLCRKVIAWDGKKKRRRGKR